MSDFEVNVDDLISKALNLTCQDRVVELTSTSDNSSTHQRNVLVGNLLFERSFSPTIIKAALSKSWGIFKPFHLTPKKANSYILPLKI
uniref:Uncharacterized protein n=1 Tax=Manihot esculenta TaxID=3983 RepID=A0A199UC11_MANES